MPTPKVSVVVLTYNHARFIDEALQSVFAQRTDFDFEILITEDCSTDGTREIVKRYAREHPSVITLLLSERNQNDNDVLTRALRVARGELIALLEGDDFWTSRDKLQRQVCFLDAHPECASCVHNAWIVDETGVRQPETFCPIGWQGPFTTRDVLRANFIPTCSTMLRRTVVDSLPSWFDRAIAQDWSLHLLCSERGAIGYLDEVMAAYRAHAGGLWSGSDTVGQLRRMVRSLEEVNDFTGRRYAAALAPRIARYEFRLAGLTRAQGDLAAAWRHLRRGMPAAVTSRQVSVREAGGLAARLLAASVRPVGVGLVRRWRMPQRVR